MTPELRQQRRDFLVGGPCAVCGGPAHDVHEIIAGANRTAAVAERACWLRVCRPCHDAIQGAGVEYQLALKLVSDPGGFDLAAFCRAWRRPETAVDLRNLLRQVQFELINRR